MHDYFFVCVLLFGHLGITLTGKTFTYNVEYDLKPIAIHRQLVWRALIDWHNPANWLPDNRLPCPKDRIALPEDYVLFLNHELDTIELVLPQNGELVFGPQGNVRLMTNDDLGEFAHRCPNDVSGSNLEFHPVEEKTPSSWFSPEHWQVVFRPPESFDFSPVESQLSMGTISNFATFISSRRQVATIVPHSERIPCTGDWVHFPTSNGSFKVTIERSSQIPSLGLLTLGTVQFTSTATFGEFAKSFRGEMLFRFGDYNHLTIRQDKTGICGNDAPKKLITICRYARPACPPRDTLACRDPITPVGHCCPICASSMTIQRARESSLSDLQLYRFVLRIMRLVHPQLPQVRLYGHWLYDGRWQLLVEDLPHEGSVEERFNDHYIQAIKSKLQSNVNLAKQLQLEITSSVEWIQDSHLIGSIVWFFFICFLISLIAFPLYTYYQRNRLDPAFTFVRFRSHTSDLNIELEVDPAGTAAANTSASQINENGANSGPPLLYQPSSFANPPSPFKSLLSPFSAPSIASIRSVLTGSSTSLSTNASSSFPNAPATGLSDSNLTTNFDNPIFRLFQSQQQQAPATAVSSSATLASASSQPSLHSSE